VLPILHRRRASGLAAPRPVLAALLVLVASLVLAGCTEADTPSPAAGMTTAGATGTSPDGSPDAGAPPSDGAATGTTAGAASTGRTTGTGKGSGAGNKAIGTPPADQQQGGPKTIVMIVKGKTVSPKTGTFKVKKGEPVLLVVVTDTDNKLHIHGADVEKETKAGKPTQVPLTFDEVGSYEVELHDPELLLTKIVVS
jgi:hypothetical protein